MRQSRWSRRANPNVPARASLTRSRSPCARAAGTPDAHAPQPLERPQAVELPGRSANCKDAGSAVGGAFESGGGGDGGRVLAGGAGGGDGAAPPTRCPCNCQHSVGQAPGMLGTAQLALVQLLQRQFFSLSSTLEASGILIYECHHRWRAHK